MISKVVKFGNLRDGWLYLLDQFDQLAMGDRLAVNLDAFHVILQMRGGIQPGLIAGGCQRRGHQRRGGAFAFRPGHMDDRVHVLRVTQQSHQGAHPPQFEMGFGEFGGFFQAIIYKRIEIIKGLIVSGFGVHSEGIVNRNA